MLLGGLLLAPRADRWGRRPMLIGCLIGASVFTAGCALAPNFATLFVSRTAVGVCLGALVANFTALVGEFAPRRFRALLIWLVASTYSVGGIVAALTAIRVIPAFGWRTVFWIGAASILLLPLLITLLPESPAYLARRPGRRRELERVLRGVAPGIDPGSVSVGTGAERPPRASVREMLRAGGTVSTVLIWVVFAMTMLLSYALNTWLPSLMTAAGYPITSGLANLVVLNLGGIIGALAAGFLADRIGSRRVIMIWFLLATSALAALALRPPAAILQLLLIVAGACTIGTLAIIHALAVEHYPAHVRSTGIGWAAGIGRIGAIGGPVLGGGLIGLALPFQVNFLAAAVPGILGALAVVLVGVSRPHRPAAPVTAPGSAPGTGSTSGELEVTRRIAGEATPSEGVEK